MFVPVEWLKQYVDIENIDIDKLSDELVMSGSKVEAVENLGEKINKIVVGKILEIQKHPDAEKLVVTQVDIGDEVLQIVTGAKNVKEGQYIPVILNGGRLPDGTKIKKGKLRGVVSNGMMCSGEELGIADKVLPMHQEKDGIYILDEAYPLGTDIKDILGLNDYIIEFEITPNRPDCLSILGMARETAATFNIPLKNLEINIKEEVDNIKDYASVEVLDSDLCNRYVARVIKDVEIKPSPQWLQNRLMKAGMRPINNIVDITNYVMLELGQPLHAFDLEKLEENKIIVKRAENGETFTTLDEVERKLDEDTLIIADGKKSVALAGVMGGLNSEVSESTKTILIESANFSSHSVRTTSKKLGLRTEASARFEKGIDPNIAIIAANRVCQLVEELGIGKVVAGVIDIYPNRAEEKVVEVRPKRINDLLGTNLTNEEMIDILERLEMKVTIKEDKFLVTVPTFRLDIAQEIDFVEEIARIYGFNNLGMTIPKGNSQGAKTNGQIIEELAKNTLNAVGLNEILTYSFVSPRTFDLLCIPEESFMRRVVKVINPLGEETSIMRTTLMGNMLEVLARNYNRNVEYAKAFELGNVFIPKSIPVNSLPIEKKVLTIGMYGKEIDFYSLKGVVERLFERLGITDYEYIPEKNHPSFHPGRCANIVYGNHTLGVIGEIHPDVMENYNIDTRVYVGEIDFNIIYQITRLDRVYKELPKYPAMTRDMALVVKEDIYVKQIEDIVKENGREILESIKLFDVYKGKQIQEGYKSVAYSLTYRAKDRTLTDEEVTKVHEKIVKELEEKLGATLR
ncbi:phenylalanine--tRNA ligase subunit beta [Crassaminicella thermophila]|uniref:Phenylalanine--tRNA ligase beta subunit n=1 Tax=Crassaminicella thermophila TaxID=2599308 RepID=A0A5C0SD84_CRATE|nr:phenylalanine--tRNA ligase subunit beta [Crassaminicella thermophila]QEK12495.1 phenylalanine--tRNA ligase subunit beta [Crassaminicella thermophila]